MSGRRLASWTETCTSVPVDQARGTPSRSLFATVCGVEVTTQASAQRVWSLLTDVEDFSRWNSTVTGIEGRIREGERLQVHVPGTDRTFTPKVCGIVPNERMTWTGGFPPIFKGVRIFKLARGDDGS